MPLQELFVRQVLFGEGDFYFLLLFLHHHLSLLQPANKSMNVYFFFLGIIVTNRECNALSFLQNHF